jgi:parvulin-like peptidyl-prolyl cis-trans isomerase-like protein
MFNKIVKEPIFHFLLAGALLYLAYQYLNPVPADSYNDNIIVVNDSILKNMLNVRSKNPEGQFNVNAALASLDEKEKEVLAMEYIEEEALYRMALEMGLNENDFIIKRRMIQKLSFLLEDLNTGKIDTSNDNLLAYYETNSEEFKTDDKVSFAHVYLSSDHHGENTITKAENTLKLLNNKQVEMSDALSHGDRFPLNHKYTKITPTQSKSHFGIKFSDSLFKLEPEDYWQGPIESGYGYHLVYINSKESGYIPPYESIRDLVTNSYTYREKQRLNRLSRQSIIEKYSVLREYE